MTDVVDEAPGSARARRVPTGTRRAPPSTPPRGRAGHGCPDGRDGDGTEPPSPSRSPPSRNLRPKRTSCGPPPPWTTLTTTSTRHAGAGGRAESNRSLVQLALTWPWSAGRRSTCSPTSTPPRAGRTTRRRVATSAPTCGRRPTCATTSSRTGGCPAGPLTGTPGSPCTSSTWWCRPCSRCCSTSSCPTAWPSRWSARWASWPSRCAAGRSARLAGLPFPIPPLFSVAAVFFLFDWSFTIYGGNVASTMAGEFSFSIAAVPGDAVPRRARPRHAHRQGPRARRVPLRARPCSAT